MAAELLTEVRCTERGANRTAKAQPVNGSVLGLKAIGGFFAEVFLLGPASGNVDRQFADGRTIKYQRQVDLGECFTQPALSIGTGVAGETLEIAAGGSCIGPRGDRVFTILETQHEAGRTAPRDAEHLTGHVARENCLFDNRVGHPVRKQVGVIRLVREAPSIKEGRIKEVQWSAVDRLPYTGDDPRITNVFPTSFVKARVIQRLLETGEVRDARNRIVTVGARIAGVCIVRPTSKRTDVHERQITFDTRCKASLRHFCVADKVALIEQTSVKAAEVAKGVVARNSDVPLSRSVRRRLSRRPGSLEVWRHVTVPARCVFADREDGCAFEVRRKSGL